MSSSIIKSQFLIIFTVGFIVFVFAGIAGCLTIPIIGTTSSPTTMVKSGESTYSFIHISDTQTVSYRFPDDLEKTFVTIESMKKDYNIKAIFHSGDLVEGWNDSLQWTRYTNAKHKTTIPVYEIAGNHDIGRNANGYNYSLFLQNTGNQQEHWVVPFEDFIVIGISYVSNPFLSNKDITEFQTAISNNPEKIPLICTHEYIREYGEIAGVGNQIKNNLIFRPSLVLSGHWGANFVNIRTVNNSRVVEDITNYQWFGNYSAVRIYSVYRSKDKVDRITIRTLRINPETKIEDELVVYDRSNPIPAGPLYADYVVKFDPRGTLTAGEISGKAPFSVKLSPLSIISPDMRCEWTFDDGTPKTSRSNTCVVTHVYLKPGYYSPGLELSTNEGAYKYSRPKLIHVT